MCHEATLLLGTGSHTWSFNTFQFSTGAPFTLAGTPSLDLRVNGSATQATAGLTLTADFDSRTGENQVALNVDNGTLALADGDWVEVFIAVGTVDSVSAVGTVVGRFYISDGSLSAGTKTDINTEVVDALNTDTYAEPGQEAPGATVTLATKLGYLYKAWRNKTTQTATLETLYADDGTTTDQKRTVSDDGTTLTSGEIGTGA